MPTLCISKGNIDLQGTHRVRSAIWLDTEERISTAPALSIARKFGFVNEYRAVGNRSLGMI